MSGLDVILGHEPTTFRDLILWWRPFHVENLVAWTKRRLGVAVAVEAPTHSQRRRLPHQRHLIDVAMTGGAADPLRHVNAVVEVDVVGQDMYSVPVNGFVCSQAFTNWRQHFRIG